MTLTEMRTLLRQDLHDQDPASYRWTDDELDRHIAHALRELSRYVPREVVTGAYTTAGSRIITLPSADITRVIGVEYLSSQYPKSYVPFQSFENHIEMLIDEEIPASEWVTLYTLQVHHLTDDPQEPSTIPPQLEDLVAVGASGYALLEQAAYTLNRVSVGGERTPQEFRQEGEARIADFRAELEKIATKPRKTTLIAHKPQ